MTNGDRASLVAASSWVPLRRPRAAACKEASLADASAAATPPAGRRPHLRMHAAQADAIDSGGLWCIAGVGASAMPPPSRPWPTSAAAAGAAEAGPAIATARGPERSAASTVSRTTSPGEGANVVREDKHLRLCSLRRCSSAATQQRLDVQPPVLRLIGCQALLPLAAHMRAGERGNNGA